MKLAQASFSLNESSKKNETKPRESEVSWQNWLTNEGQLFRLVGYRGKNGDRNEIASPSLWQRFAPSFSLADYRDANPLPERPEEATDYVARKETTKYTLIALWHFRKFYSHVFLAISWQMSRGDF